MSLRRYPLVVCSIAALGASPLVHAQAETPPPQASTLQLDEILVTARKRDRDETLQSIPENIQAFSSEQLDNMAATSFEDYKRKIPSLTVIDNGPGQAQIILRGISAGRVANDTTQNRPTTALYFDEIPVSATGFNPDLDLFDVQRIEVLKGPQGTLYGSSSMGGTIRLMTRQPDATAVDSQVKVIGSVTEGGGFNNALKGMLNIPVSEDELAVRVVGYYADLDGYIDNPLNGEEDWNETTIQGGRISALWDVSEALSIQANIYHQDLDQNGSNWAISAEPFVNRIPANDSVTYEDQFTIYNLALDVDLGWANLVSSTAYNDRNFTLSSYFGYVVELFFGQPLNYIYNRDNDYEAFTQELRLNSTGDGPFSWVVGAYYEDQKRDILFDGMAPGFDALVGAPSSFFGAPAQDLPFYGLTQSDLTQLALFGELSYDFFEHVNLTVGLRYFDYDQDFDLFYSGLFNGGASTSIDSKESDGLNPKANLSYAFSGDALVYVQAAKGFRSGGVNDPFPADLCGYEAPSTFDEDTLWSYEFGWKADLMNDRVRFNGAVYRLDWNDIQTTFPEPACGFAYIDNAEGATSDGVELELTTLLLEGLTIGLGASYNDAERDDGEELPYVSEYMATASLEYIRRIPSDWQLTFYGDLQYTDDSMTTFSSLPEARSIPSATTANISVTARNDNWELQLFIKNLTDETLVNNIEPTSIFYPWQRETLGRPRTFGVSLGYRM